METISSKPRIAIIGAGPTGLLSCRHLKDIADVTVFEAKSKVGGLWNYSEINKHNHPNLQQDPYYQLYGSLHSSLYENLICDIPKHCMTYKDFPHKENTPYILTSQQFLQYLNDYSEHFGLTRFIQFETLVLSVNLTQNVSSAEIENFGLKEEEKRKFIVTTAKMDNQKEKMRQFFDYVFVCNGHFSKPHIPNIPGQDEFDGKQIHTHDLKTIDPELFHKKNVLIVGTSISANDQIHILLGERALKQNVEVNTLFVTGTGMGLITKSTELMPWRKSGKLVLNGGEVISSPSSMDQDKIPAKDDQMMAPVEEKKEIPAPIKSKTTSSEQTSQSTPEVTKGGGKSLHSGRKVVFNDGTSKTIDTIIYATGYLHCLPFLTNTSDNLIEFSKDDPGYYYGPLYMRMFAIREPNLIFIGNFSRAYVGHPTFERQVMLAKQVIEGKVKLPSQSQMLEELEAELKKFDESSYGRKGYFFNGTEFFLWKYNRDMIKMNTMEEDESYKIIEPVEMAILGCILAGNFGQMKTFDYGKYFDGVPYYPTSSKF